MSAIESDLHEKLLDAQNAATRRYNLLRRALESLIRVLSDEETHELRNLLRDELKTPILGGQRQKYTLETLRAALKREGVQTASSDSDTVIEYPAVEELPLPRTVEE